ncbi:MAG: class I SAM-dependent methyltransferase [Anaerolineales bacterium]|nr:class I SAM-dependent methyltransferase [Anaerolineales bacterium]
MTGSDLLTLLERCLNARQTLFDEKHEAALRLFNGFIEGEPRLVADLYGHTLVIHNYADPFPEGSALAEIANSFFRERLPWLETVILKTRCGTRQEDKRGNILYGGPPDLWVREYGVLYAINLLMNRDASLYLDTRHLRKWAGEQLQGKRVLNVFAYTGSLGVAARAGGARQVVHTDLNRKFLNVAKTSYTLNGFPIDKNDFRTGDFWPVVSRLKRSGAMFDCVFLDPPFFSATDKGSLDLARDSRRLINKVRPLIADGGVLAAINNAVFLSGQEYLQTLEALCADGYLEIETLVPVPDDFTGYPETRQGSYPVSPEPFNHPTKIALLRVRRKKEGSIDVNHHE